MEYGRWVEARRPLWDEVEARIGAALKRGNRMSFDDLEELALAYRRVLHDAAVARARFPGSAAARRLERLGIRGAYVLQGDLNPERFTFRRFYARTFPRACRSMLPHLRLVTALFLVAALFAALAALGSPALGLRLLGPARFEALREGKLWTESLVTAAPPGAAASGIATNNMSVALVAWAGGTLAGLGPIYVAVVNGALLGGLLGVTYHFGMAGALLGFVLSHGPLEIFLVLMSSGAGLYLAQGIVAATDRPRARLLREHAAISTVVVVGSLPWFLLLGLVEAFVSPQPALPPAFKAALGLVLLATYLAVAFNGGWGGADAR
ncbi:MAG: stage II sporulation protein M [Acidobacteria bacterium]|nr:stage II sporulation protein M [Acidobacteriota bacterium]